MEYKRGQIFEFTTSSGVKKCLIVSGNHRTSDAWQSGILLSNESHRIDDVKITVNGIIMFASPNMIGICHEDKIGRYVCQASGAEMERLDVAIAKALGIKLVSTATKEDFPTDEDITEVASLRAEAKIYKKLYEDLIDKIMEG